jgi:hypothetical protein
MAGRSSRARARAVEGLRGRPAPADITEFERAVNDDHLTATELKPGFVSTANASRSSIRSVASLSRTRQFCRAFAPTRRWSSTRATAPMHPPNEARTQQLNSDGLGPRLRTQDRSVAFRESHRRATARRVIFVMKRVSILR